MKAGLGVAFAPIGRAQRHYTFKRINLVAAAVAVTTVAGLSPAAYGDGFLLEEVLVTAQKREQSVNDIGMAVTAYQGSDLETLGFNDSRDLANLVPGLTMAMSSSGTPIYTMRGVGFNTPNMSSSSPVGVYFDEVSYPYSIMTKGLTFDVDRVEILKGPQGTLYGRNTTGGLINYIAKKPTQEFEASIKTEIGSYDSFGVEGFVNSGVTDTLSARFSFKTNRADEGWQKSVSRGEKLGEVDRSALRLALAWEPTDDFRAMFSVNWWEDNSDTQAGQAINYNPEAFTEANEAQALAIFGASFPGLTGRELAEMFYVQPGLADAILQSPDSRDADWVAADQPGSWSGTTFTERPRRLDLDSEMLSLAFRADWDLNDQFTLTSLTSYADMERDDIYDRDATPYELVIFNDIGTIKSFSQELRVSGQLGDAKVIGGIFYSRDKATDTSNPWAAQTSTLNRLRLLVSSAAAGAGASAAQVAEIRGGFRSWQNYSQIDTEVQAVFTQFEYALTDNLGLTVGLRYTEDDAEFEGCSRGDGNIQALWNAAFGTSIAPDGCITFNETLSAPVEMVTGDLQEDNVSGRLALDWKVSEDTLLYASYARGYKSGAFPQLSANVETQYAAATQEKVDAFEIGIKTALSDNAHLNASTYYYEYEDKQVFGEVLDPVFKSLTRLVNVPKSEVRGAELDLTWLPLNNLTTVISLSYLDTEITEFVGYDKFAQEKDFSGADFEYSPQWQGNAIASYFIPVGNSLEASVTVDVSYSSQQQADFEGDPSFAIDEYTVWGLNLGLKANSGRWQANAWVKNLTDEYYWTSVQTQTDTTFRYAAMPRTFGASLRFNFD